MLESNHMTKDKDSLRFLEHHNHYTDQKLRRILRNVKTLALEVLVLFGEDPAITQ